MNAHHTSRHLERNHRIAVSVAGLLGTAAIVTACGNDSDPTSQPVPAPEAPPTGVELSDETTRSGLDACSLGAEDIAALVGDPAKPKSFVQARAATCEWTGAPGKYGVPRTLAVSVWPGEEYYSVPEGVVTEQPPGLGDRSWMNAKAGHVMWVKDGRTVDVFVPLGGPTKAELITVARAVSDDLD